MNLNHSKKFQSFWHWTKCKGRISGVIDNPTLIIFEKINLGGRLRHFGLDKNGKLFIDSESHFYVSMDKDGLYKVKFSDFR